MDNEAFRDQVTKLFGEGFQFDKHVCRAKRGAVTIATGNGIPKQAQPHGQWYARLRIERDCINILGVRMHATVVAMGPSCEYVLTRLEHDTACLADTLKCYPI